MARPVNFVDPTGHNGVGVEELQAYLWENNLYLTMDEAAIAWSNIYLPESIENNREYGGLIYEDVTKMEDGTKVTVYGYTKAVKGTVGHVMPLRAIIYKPLGTKTVAYIHTHPYDAEAGFTHTEAFSEQDKRSSEFNRKPNYMAAERPDETTGLLVVYLPATLVDITEWSEWGWRISESINQG